MVCNNLTASDDSVLRRRAEILGVSIERARFLVRCAHSRNLLKKKSEHIVVIPYDPRVQLDEALRLGIGLKDTAKMMKMAPKEITAMGYDFPAKSSIPRVGGRGPYSLFQWEPMQGEADLYPTK
jgi:hypothetical protein